MRPLRFIRGRTPRFDCMQFCTCLTLTDIAMKFLHLYHWVQGMTKVPAAHANLFFCFFTSWQMLWIKQSLIGWLGDPIPQAVLGVEEIQSSSQEHGEPIDKWCLWTLCHLWQHWRALPLSLVLLQCHHPHMRSHSLSMRNLIDFSRTWALAFHFLDLVLTCMLILTHSSYLSYVQKVFPIGACNAQNRHTMEYPHAGLIHLGLIHGSGAP